MQLNKIQKCDFKNKKVLLRVDFNVPIKDGKIKDAHKIQVAKDTIDHITSQGGKVTMASHLGRPLEFHKNNPGAEWTKHFSLRQLLPFLKELLGYEIIFIPSCHPNVIKKTLEEFPSKRKALFLLENVRFNEGEKKNDEKFSRKLAENFDVFVNEAFSVSHRAHASVVGVTKFLSAYAGFQFQREVKNLERVKKYPEHPAVAIIGGAKIATKLPLIEALSENYDFILVGGKVANEAIDQRINFNSRVILPVDFADKGRFDIGEYTIKEFVKTIEQAETIIWNGPLGLFEKKPYDRGTKKIMDAIIKSGAFSVVGGGESVEVVNQNNLRDKFSFVSTGGGAMLEFLSGEPMPGLDVLLDQDY